MTAHGGTDRHEVDSAAAANVDAVRAELNLAAGSAVPDSFAVRVAVMADATEIEFVDVDIHARSGHISEMSVVVVTASKMIFCLEQEVWDDTGHRGRSSLTACPIRAIRAIEVVDSGHSWDTAAALPECRSIVVHFEDRRIGLPVSERGRAQAVDLLRHLARV